jgi:hypothetical protein
VHLIRAREPLVIESMAGPADFVFENEKWSGSAARSHHAAAKAPPAASRPPRPKVAAEPDGRRGTGLTAIPTTFFENER